MMRIIPNGNGEINIEIILNEITGDTKSYVVNIPKNKLAACDYEFDGDTIKITLIALRKDTTQKTALFTGTI